MAKRKKKVVQSRALDWGALGGVGSDMMDVIKPYLPALAREGEAVFNGFIKHLLDKNWSEIDKLMYVKMTIAERRELEDAAIKGGRQAALDRFNRIELTKQIAFKLMLRLAMMAVL